MSRYAWLACSECKVMLGLGKAVIGEDDKVNYFRLGLPDESPNSERIWFNKVLWKLLAEHAGHNLRILMDDDPEYQEIGDYIEVGGDQQGDIDFDSYLHEWKD